MSHVVNIDVKITSLSALKKACAAMKTLQFMENQKTYRWWGRSVGDYPLPEGFTAEDLGKCDHAIRVVDRNGRQHPTAYELGVVKRKDGQGYTFLFDFFNGGRGLYTALTGKPYDHNASENDVAAHLNQLYQEYTLNVVEDSEDVKTYISEGWNVERIKQPDQSVHIVLTK